MSNNNVYDSLLAEYQLALLIALDKANDDQTLIDKAVADYVCKLNGVKDSKTVYNKIEMLEKAKKECKSL